MFLSHQDNYTSCFFERYYKIHLKLNQTLNLFPNNTKILSRIISFPFVFIISWNKINDGINLSSF